MTAPRTARVALVTGANQNLGRALVAGLAAAMAPSDLVLLTGRDRERVERAARELSAAESRRATIEPIVLDVRDRQAVRDLAAGLGPVDIVFSNAASRMAPDADPAAEVDAVVETNNLATTEILRSFGPRLRPGGRLVIVASALGTLDKLDPVVRERFRAAAVTGLDAVDELVEQWRASVKAGRAELDGFGTWLNIPSKVAQVAAVRAAAGRRRDDPASGRLVLAMCPGLLDTAASRPWFSDMRGARTPTEAAVWPVRMALQVDADPVWHGELVQSGRVVPWETGMKVPHRVVGGAAAGR